LVADLNTALDKTVQPAAPVRPESRVSLRGHVVYRELPLQTVVLNIATGKYHGLNPSSGRMLAALEGGGTVAAAARMVADRYGEPRARIEHDLCELCSRLLERGILRVLGSHGE
jgi:Coenzyme PQQ synthesis protein D (PqqD)